VSKKTNKVVDNLASVVVYTSFIGIAVVTASFALTDFVVRSSITTVRHKIFGKSW